MPGSSRCQLSDAVMPVENNGRLSIFGCCNLAHLNQSFSENPLDLDNLALKSICLALEELDCYIILAFNCQDLPEYCAGFLARLEITRLC